MLNFYKSEEISEISKNQGISQKIGKKAKNDKKQ